MYRLIREKGSAPSVAKNVRLITAAPTTSSVASKRNVCTSGLSLIYVVPISSSDVVGVQPPKVTKCTSNSLRLGLIP